MVDKLAAAIDAYKDTRIPSRDPVSQFERVNKVSDWLASNEPTLETLNQAYSIFRRFQRMAESHLLSSEFLLNSIQILRYADRFGYTDFYESHRKLDDSVFGVEQWLELIDSDTPHPDRSTFFLSEVAENILIDSTDYEYAVDATKDLLESLLEILEAGVAARSSLRKGSVFRSISRYNQGLFSLARFNALASIQHEITENALSHATYSSLNERAWPNTNSAFGHNFYLQVNNITAMGRDDVDKIERFHSDLPSYHKVICDRTNLQNQSYWILSYCDTGSGILAHVKGFHPNSEIRERGLSISELISEKISTRRMDGSGYGLEKVCQFSRTLAGFVVIDTKGTCFTYNGIEGSSSESEGRVSRGTMISIVVPASLADAISNF